MARRKFSFNASPEVENILAKQPNKTEFINQAILAYSLKETPFLFETADSDVMLTDHYMLPRNEASKLLANPMLTKQQKVVNLIGMSKNAVLLETNHDEVVYKYVQRFYWQGSRTNWQKYSKIIRIPLDQPLRKILDQMLREAVVRPEDELEEKLREGGIL